MLLGIGIIASLIMFVITVIVINFITSEIESRKKEQREKEYRLLIEKNREIRQEWLNQELKKPRARLTIYFNDGGTITEDYGPSEWCSYSDQQGTSALELARKRINSITNNNTFYSNNVYYFERDVKMMIISEIEREGE